MIPHPTPSSPIGSLATTIVLSTWSRLVLSMNRRLKRLLRYQLLPREPPCAPLPDQRMRSPRSISLLLDVQAYTIPVMLRSSFAALNLSLQMSTWWQETSNYL